MWIEKVTFVSDVLSEAYCLAASKTSLPLFMTHIARTERPENPRPFLASDFVRGVPWLRGQSICPVCPCEMMVLSILKFHGVVEKHFASSLDTIRTVIRQAFANSQLEASNAMSMVTPTTSTLKHDREIVLRCAETDLLLRMSHMCFIGS